MKKTWRKWAMAAAAMFGCATMATTAQAEQAPASDYELSDSAVSNFSPISITNSKTNSGSYAAAKITKSGFNLSAKTLEDISQMAKVETASSNAYSAKPIAKSLNISATAPTSDYARLKTTPQEPSSTAHTQTVGPMKIPAYTISHIPDDFKLMGKKMETGLGFKLPIQKADISSSYSLPKMSNLFQTTENTLGARLDIPATYLPNDNTLNAYLPMSGKSKQPSTGITLPPLRTTFITLVAVKHFSQLHVPKGWGSNVKWNEGLMKNKGGMLEIDTPVAQVSPTIDFRIGVTGGSYKNSFEKKSNIGGINFSLEKRITDKFSAYAGIPLGAVTGYGDKTRPVMIPYAGVSQELVKGIRIGARAQWMPVQTGASLAGVKGKYSDVIAGSATLSFGF